MIAPRLIAPRLIATDLDGTLLNTAHQVSARTKRALTLAQDAGAAVVLVTGRPSRMVLALAAELGLRGFAVCSNGAQTLDLALDRAPDRAGGAAVDTQAIAPEVLRRVIPALRAACPGIMFGLEWGYGLALDRGLRDGPDSFDDVLEAYAPGSRLTPGPVLKLMARAPGLSAAQLAAQAEGLSGGGVVGTFSGASFAELHAPHVSKAYALERLSARLGIPAAEAIAFGDAPNDLAMLGWAGRAVLMGNALPEMAAVVGERTLSNDEDGVAVVLERLYSPQDPGGVG